MNHDQTPENPKVHGDLALLELANAAMDEHHHDLTTCTTAPRSSEGLQRPVGLGQPMTNSQPASGQLQWHRQVVVDLEKQIAFRLVHLEEMPADQANELAQGDVPAIDDDPEGTGVPG